MLRNRLKRILARLDTPSRLIAAGGAIILSSLILYASTFVVSYGELLRADNPLMRTDVARLTTARVQRVYEIRGVKQLQSVVRDAAERGLKVSIAGSRHSQGGHTYTEGGVVLDMRSFNRIRTIDGAAMTVTVESGATWDEVQRAIAPRGLAITAMQSSNVFTVGGTLSANAHGRDIDVTQVVETVERFSLLLADGSVVEVSRGENAELFSLVIGGYGLYGVILDVTLRVTPDELYEQRLALMDYAEFPGYVAEQVQPDTRVVLLLGRPSIDPDPDSFLREMVVVIWRHVDEGQAGSFELTEEENVLRDKFLFSLSRRFDWAKSWRWSLQKRFEFSTALIVSRNNGMRPPVAPVEFLDYSSRRDSDILQEYFVPVENFVPFMDRFREVLIDGDVNVLSSTVRYVEPNVTPALAYAPRGDVFAVILVSNVELSEEGQVRAESVTRQLIDATLEYGGTYYLTYQPYATPEQLHRAYPTAQRAFDRKRFYDPSELFSSQFYERYGHTLAR